MRFRLMFTALMAVLAACVLTLGFAGTAAAAQGGGSQSTATSGPGNSSQGCDGSHNSDTGNGANHSGPYDNTCDGSPSGNGNGNGQAVGKPCAGCVGNADDKNPKGQYPNGSDHNAGYECDRNHGIGRTNPAHTGCRTTETTGGCTTPGGCNGGCTTPGGCSNGCTTPGGCSNGCTTPGGCGNGNECTTPGGCGGNETPPGQQVAGTSSGPPATPPATPPETPQQAVLGTRAAGTSPAHTTPTSSHAAAPASATAPASTVSARPASSTHHGSLPFTGADVLPILLAGVLMLVTGLGMNRLLAHRD